MPTVVGGSSRWFETNLAFLFIDVLRILRINLWHFLSPSWTTELGMQKHCRNNVIMFSGQKTVAYYIMAMGYSLWLLGGLNIFRFFLFVSAALNMLLRSRVVVVAKLSNCRVPSSAPYYHMGSYYKILAGILSIIYIKGLMAWIQAMVQYIGAG